MQINRTHSPSFQANARLHGAINDIHIRKYYPHQCIPGVTEQGNHPITAFINSISKAIQDKPGTDSITIRLSDKKGNAIGQNTPHDDISIKLEKLEGKNDLYSTGFSVQDIISKPKEAIGRALNIINI